MTASQEILALTIALGYHRGQPLSWIGEDPVPVASQPFPLDIDEAPRLIPIGPLSATSPLSQDRVFELCDRYAARGPKEGWILVPTQESTMPEFRNAIATYLLSHYTVVRSLSTDHYLMSYCRRK
jgi:hypothetical protein